MINQHFCIIKHFKTLKGLVPNANSWRTLKGKFHFFLIQKLFSCN